MKRILSVVLTLCLFLSVFTVVNAEEVQTPVVSEKYISNTKMLKALGIGDFTAEAPTEKITRGEFAEIMAGLLNIRDTANVTLPFLDVDKNHPNYNAICAVYSYGIMNGVSSVQFDSDGYITYNQAVKCIVSVLGYGDIAFTYPDDYISIALRLDILKGLGNNSDEFTWEKAVQLAVNSFDAAIMTIHSVGTDSVVYQPDDKKTILGVYHNIYKSKGRVTDNGITSITGAPVYAKDYMVINNIAGVITDNTMHEYIGQTVEFYYQADGEEETKILYIFPNDTAADVLVINADDLAKDSQSFTKTNIVYYNEGGKTINAKVDQYADMIYNGKSFPTFLVGDIKIDAGTITLIDEDNDRVYDLIVAEEYRDFIITSVDTTDMTISDENGNVYSYNPEKIHSSFYDAGLQSIGIEEFVNGYIVSLFESKDGEYRKFVLSGASVTGVVDGIEEEDGEVTVYIDGAAYKYSPTFLENIENGIRDEFIPKMGLNVKVYLNYEGKIASIDLNARDFLYAYCLAIAPKTGGMSNTVQLKVVTEKNDEVILNSAKEVEINGVKSAPADLLTIPAFENSKTGEFVPQLVRIKTNSDGELKMIMTAEENTTNLGFTDKDTFNLATSYGAGSTGGRGYGTYYSTDKDTVYFRIAREDNYHEPEVMAIKTKPQAYANMKIYDVDEFWNAGAMVFQDNNTYSNYMGRVFIVTKVFTTFDAQRNPVKAIKGYQQTGEWTYVEAEEGLIDHYIPEGIKIGDVVQLQVDDAKNLRTIEKMISLADKQAPVTSGSIATDGISYVYGYLCNKDASTVVISMDNYDLGTTSNIQMRTIPTTASIYVFDVQEKSFRKTTLREIPINATMENDRYNIIDENLMVFAKTARANATELIFIKY